MTPVRTMPIATSTFATALLAALALGGCTSLSEPEIEDDPCVATTPIAVGQSMNGQLDEGDCRQPDGALGDRWGLELTEQTSLQIDLTSSVFDPVLELRSQSGAVLARNDDFQSLNSRINHTLPAGSYVILARSYGERMAGSYQLTVAEGPDCSPVGELEVGQSVAGSLTSDDCVFDHFTIDNWTLEVTSPQELRIEMRSDDFDVALLLRDERGDVYYGAGPNGPSGDAIMEVDLPPGRWTVSAGGTTTGTSYSLTADLAPPCAPGTDMRIGHSVSGDISWSDCLFDGWAPADSFAVTLDAESAIDIRLKSADFEPFMVLRDQTGRDVAVGWADMTAGTARIRTSLEAGTYALFALSYDWPPEGAYQLSIADIECSAMGSLGVDESASGTLTVDDCARAGGAYQDLWELDVTADATVRIDLTSPDFDAYLTLRDDLDDVIATDDDGGSGLDSRIEVALAAGAYTISASSFGAGQTGAYDLATSVVTPVAAAVPEVTVDVTAGTTVKAAAVSFGLAAGSPSRTLERLRREWQLSSGGASAPLRGGKIR